MAAGELRRPFFLAAVVVALLVVLAEIGLSLVVSASSPQPAPGASGALGVPPGVTVATENGADPPGAGIASLALLDGLLFFTVLMLGLSLVMPLRLYGRVQGIVTLVVTFLWILATLILTLLAFAKLLLMIGLFVAVPFGTAAYLVIWGGFPSGAAAAILASLLLLKIVFGVLLVIAQPRFLRVKGLVILVLLSVLLQLVLGFLHGLLPGPVVSIGDQFWAVIVGVVALIWALIMLIGSIPAIVNAIRVSGSLAESP
jgi:hypothetical protein